MAREVFPYEGDRETIRTFLSGSQLTATTAFGVSTIHQGKLHISGDVFAWYDTQGALWAHIGVGHVMHTQIRAFNYIAELVGLSAYLVVERRQEGDVIRTQLWFDGQEIGYNSPFVVLGSLSMRAWRESALIKSP